MALLLLLMMMMISVVTMSTHTSHTDIYQFRYSHQVATVDSPISLPVKINHPLNSLVCDGANACNIVAYTRLYPNSIPILFPFYPSWRLLVGALEHGFDFSIQLGIIIPTDSYFFQRGRSTTNQMGFILRLCFFGFCWFAFWCFLFFAFFALFFKF